MTDDSLDLRRQLKSDPAECAELIRDLMESLRSRDWTEDDCFAVRMAVEEAVMNGMKHGNQLDDSKTIDVEIKLTDDRFWARISDEGGGFSLDDVPDPTKRENLEKCSGRGVKLIQSFVDSCQYNKAGNTVELVKFKSDN